MRFYLLNLTGVIIYSCLFVTIPLLFKTIIPAALNLTLVVAHMTCTTVMRYDHYGMVCSGDYLPGVWKIPDNRRMRVKPYYLLNTGRFLFAVQFFVWPMVLLGWSYVSVLVWRRFR